MWENIIAGNSKYHGMYHREHNLQIFNWVLFLFQNKQLIPKNNFNSPFLSHFLPCLLSCSAYAERLPCVNYRMKENACL